MIIDLFQIIGLCKCFKGTPQFIRYLKLKQGDAEEDEAPQTWEGRMNQTKTELKKMKSDLEESILMKVADMGDKLLRHV